MMNAGEQRYTKWLQVSYPFVSRVPLGIDGLLRSIELLVERKFARNDADLLAELGRLRRKRVDVQTVSGRLASCLTESFNEFLLLFGGDGSIAEKDDSSLRTRRGKLATARDRQSTCATHTKIAKSRSFFGSFKTSRTLKDGLPSLS